jgi:hypothetical protein
MLSSWPQASVSKQPIRASAARYLLSLALSAHVEERG